MVGNQADMDNVGAATEAAKEIFDIIDKVCMYIYICNTFTP